MAESRHQGVMAMVNIDGGKVKSLREQKGLTQLYVATAVMVTTDTISRWENKRYPTIKKENALRLAEALEVELENILESEEEARVEQPEDLPPVKLKSQRARRTSRVRPYLLALVIFVFLSTFAAFFYFSPDTSPAISATRSLPDRYIVNEPFPVTIEVVGAEDDPVSLIIKEQLPPSVTISATEPTLPKSGVKNDLIKWLHKAQGRMLFTYIATITDSSAGESKFSGTISAGDNAENPIAIMGSDTISPGVHHWADSDGDNVISDKEILTVYDQYGNLEQLGIDIDLIEEIWLGSGYRWDESSHSYIILP